MIPYIRFSPKLTTSLRVDNHFSELLRMITVPTINGPKSSYEFDVKCSVSTSSLDQYEKIIVTVVEKKEDDTDNKEINEPPSPALPRLAASLQRKAYSGLYLSSLINKTPSFLIQKTINISSSNYNLNSVYLTKKLEREQNSDSRNSFSVSLPQDSLNTKDLLRSVNKEKIDVTECVKEPIISSIKSPVNFQDSMLLGDGNSLYSKTAKYYINESPRRPDDSGLVTYKVQEYQTTRNYIDFSTKFLLDLNYRSSILEVKFELYKFNSTVPDETVEKELNLFKHIEAFESIQRPPEASASLSLDELTVNISISDREREGKVSKFNIYKKDIDPDGSSTSYSLLDTLENQGSILTLRKNSSSNLMVFRIVPVDYSGKESNVYTNIVAGKGHQEIGNIALITSFDPDPRSLKTRLTAYNIPTSARRLEVWRRVLSRTEGLSVNDLVNFQIIYAEPRSGDTFEFFDFLTTQGILSGSLIEYYVKCIFDNEVFILSNYVLVDTKSALLINDSINVRTYDFKKYISPAGDVEVSFNIETSVDQSENKRIIDSLKENLKEIYDQLVNPANSADSVVSAAGSKPLYADLYVHEVVRTNLNTSEREVFTLVTDGIFKDDIQNRTISRVKPLIPEHSYVYQTFSYVKDPLTLFRNYVKKVRDPANKTYYYMPYKWDNPLINASKTMPSTDEDELPLLETYDSFTSRPIGEKSQRNQTQGSTDFASVTRVKFERIDRNTVKVFWDFNIPDFTKIYDSFVVLKSVNGVRKFVGRTMKNFIYHEITEEDLGSIYYSVIPFTIEFDIDDSAHSENFVLDPEEIVEPKLLL